MFLDTGDITRDVPALSHITIYILNCHMSSSTSQSVMSLMTITSLLHESNTGVTCNVTNGWETIAAFCANIL